MKKQTVCNAIFLLSLSACSMQLLAEDAVAGISGIKTDIKQWAAWSALPDVADVRNNVSKTLVEKLGLSVDYAASVPVSRVFTSEWYQVKVDDKVYVVDQYARYWLMVDGNVNFFMFENGVQSVNVSNRSRDSMLNAKPLLDSAIDTMVVYPSLHESKKEVVYVFMDLSCPHSKSFHLTRRQELQLAGFEFRYIPFAALRKSNQIEALTKLIWCADTDKSKHGFIDDVYLSGNISAAYAKINQINDAKKSCNAVQKNALSVFDTFIENHQLTGTPVFLNESGIMFYGVASFERGNTKELNVGVGK